MSEHVEYGVIVDRTSDGLGSYLAFICVNQEEAQEQADGVPHYPATVQRRTVIYSEWENIT